MTKNGKYLYLYREYTYYCKRSKNSSSTNKWYCSTHHNKRCNARLYFVNSIPHLINTHTHPPNKFVIHQGVYVKLGQQYDDKYEQDKPCKKNKKGKQSKQTKLRQKKTDKQDKRYPQDPDQQDEIKPE